MTEQDAFQKSIEQHLLDRKDDIIRGALEGTVKSIQENLRWGGANKVQEEINKFFEKEVGPAVIKYLAEQRESIIAATIASCKTVLDATLKSFAEKRIEELTKSSYSNNDLMKALLGVSGRY